MDAIFHNTPMLVIAMGGLIIWPLARICLGPTEIRSVWLKWIFGGHLILLGVIAAALYYSSLKNPQWIYGAVWFYLIGISFLFLSLSVLLFGNLKGNKKQGRKKK